MGKTFEFSLQSKSFDQAIAEISKMTGRSQSDVLKNEARAILGQSMKNTGKPDKKLIRGRYNYKGEGDDAPGIVKVFERIDGKKVRVRSILRKGVWETSPKGKRVFKKNKINPMFRKLESVLKERMKKALADAGQSKATFIYLANKLKLRDPSKEKAKFGGVTIPAYVLKALSRFPRSLKQHLNTHETGEDDYSITIRHSGSTALAPATKKGPGGTSAFAKAWIGRIVFFKENMERGVFTSAKKVLAKYPGLKIHKN